jgi:carbonic anhydrase
MMTRDNDPVVFDEAHEPDLPTEGSHPTVLTSLDAEAALERLRRGNAAYRQAHTNTGSISANEVARLFEEGQAPYACIVTCADSRVVPEHIFMTGIGELFTIRCAGNVAGPMELASALYAAEHLGVKLVLVLGHTHCGAVEAGMELADAPDGAPDLQNAIRSLAECVMAAIGSERDPYRAALLNAQAATAALMADPDIAHLADSAGLQVRTAIYHTHSGEVEFLA